MWNDKRRDNYHRRRAQKKATSTGDPVLLADIAERDGWRCHICGKAVNSKLKWPHVKSASLDHLVPLSKGGAHDPANVRLAHLGCNSAKGNRGGGEQLLLIG
ncbi:HNH endonuclease [Streptomyces sp. NPDC008222]|uniref:HNH endonuclease n=1 Tax=Streptomyces sp. NPDC008222 TaxID=3364820 RepID=UPI0036ECF65E